MEKPMKKKLTKLVKIHFSVTLKHILLLELILNVIQLSIHLHTVRSFVQLEVRASWRGSRPSWAAFFNYSTLSFWDRVIQSNPLTHHLIASFRARTLMTVTVFSIFCFHFLFIESSYVGAMKSSSARSAKTRATVRHRWYAANLLS